MKAEITVKQLWYNPSIMRFFMRKQAQRHLADLVSEFGSTMDEQEDLFDRIESTYQDHEDLEEDLYNLSMDEFAFNIGLIEED